jgi:flagellar protein FliS
MAKPLVANALQQYQNVGVNSGLENATPHRLIQMLMEGALDKMSIAKGHMERKEYDRKSHFLSWSITVINGLKASLDMESGGEISANLDDLYDYMIRRLMVANATNDTAIVDEVLSLLLEVKSAWCVIPQQLAAQSKQMAV